MINKIKEQLGILYLPLLMFLLLGPMEIWAGNRNDFEFLWGDFFWYFLLLFFILLVLGALVLSIIPHKVLTIIDTIIFIGTLSCYIQVMFLNVKLAEDNGGKMQWAKMKGVFFINTLIWVFIFAFGMYFLMKNKKIQMKMVSYGSAFLAAIQTIALLFLIILNWDGKGKVQETYWFNGEQQFEVAEGKNIILFVLDSFGSTQLELALEQDESLLEGMHDFTYYNNADPVYYRTFPSMTHILTGIDYDPDMAARSWLDFAWNHDRVEEYYQNLHENGYGCFLHSDNISYTYRGGKNLVDKFDNIKKEKAVIYHREWLFSKILKMTLYRYSPYVMKPFFEVLTSEFTTIVDHAGSANDTIGDMIEFRYRLNEKGLSVSNNYQNALIVQHLGGTHAPLYFNENCEVVPEEETDHGKTVRGNFVILYEYLEELKRIGKYDDSVIIITADHGEWQIEGRLDLQVIFFMKEANESHDKLKISNAPIHHCDILPTIYEAAGFDYTGYGTSVKDWQENDVRERTLYDLNDDILRGWTYTSKEELYKKALLDPDVQIKTEMY